MESSYVLWHTQRQGWITKSGITSTDFSDAATFGRSEALHRCSIALGHDKSTPVVPVVYEDVVEILA